MHLKLKNNSLGSKEEITTFIKDAFEDIGKIVSIKSLVIEETPYLTDHT
ncbi:7546_t:CDS:2 [Racocetra fulgida]|uniref:7546_t:CDS:1 n=1 Tax=Racocetra fulgida TaxID=60492 RepID=A0A9N8Z0W2_9GLOM|nr:7546_t:CDS:2 [Racocetra fulgida]